MLSDDERLQFLDLLQRIEEKPHQEFDRPFLQALLGPQHFPRFGYRHDRILRDQLKRQAAKQGIRMWPPAIRAYYDRQYEGIDTYRGATSSIERLEAANPNDHRLLGLHTLRQCVHDELWKAYEELPEEDMVWLEYDMPKHKMPLPRRVCTLEGARLSAVFPDEPSADCQALKWILLELLDE